MAATRFNFWIDNDVRELLERASKYSDKSMGELINNTVRAKLGDPVKVITEKMKSLQGQLIILRDKRTEIENARAEKEAASKYIATVRAETE